MAMIVRNLIHILIDDLIKNSRKLINKWKKSMKINNSEDFYKTKANIGKLINLSPEMKRKFKNLDTTIRDHIINSETVNRMDARAKYFIKDIFKAYFNDPRQLPSYLLHRYERTYNKEYLRTVHYRKIENTIKKYRKGKNFIRMICDHIAGMTDNFALSEHQKLYLSSASTQLLS